MYFRIILVLVALCMVNNHAEANTDKVVCYYGSWATYRTSYGKFNVEDIGVNLCTHIIYSFIGINADGTIKILDDWNEIQLGALNRFNALKKLNKNVKTLIAIGGWNEGSISFTRVVSSDTLRAKFVASVIGFLRKYNFDGFDLDWEYPAQRGGAASDKANFALLCKELRAAFDSTSEKYLLSAAVAATGAAADISYDVPALSKYLDFINIMAYDLHAFYDGATGQNAPLYPSSIDKTQQALQLNVQACINAWLARGAAPEKLVLGLGVYGKTFTLASSHNHQLGASANRPGNAGPYTREEGMLGYNEICEKLQQGGWTEVWDDEQKVPYMYMGNQWVGYDNPRSIKIKVDFAKSLNLGGLMIWSIETDDFHGRCGPKNPILNAIHQALGTEGGSEGNNEISGEGGENKSSEENLSGEPSKVPPKPTESPTGTQCTEAGYIRDVSNCSIFYYCLPRGDGFTQSKFICPHGLYFDVSLSACNYPNLVTC